MNGKQFQTKDNTTIQRVSRWIKLRRVTVTKRHSLAEYADFAGTDNPNEGTLTYFIHNGKKYAYGQFSRLSYPTFFEDEDGKTSYLSGYDNTEWYKPYLIEVDECCEYVRLYLEIERAA
jgi:hypothetical protein